MPVFVPRAVRLERMAICQACDHATGPGPGKRKFFCSKCDCVLEGKTRVAGDSCPIGKWHPHQPSGAKQ